MQFLGLFEEECSREKAKVVILPVPYEATTSYGKGTVGGPAAILEASQQVELFDEELVCEPFRSGIFTEKAIQFGKFHGLEALQLIETAVAKIVGAGQFPITLGGEHSISLGPVKALHRKYPDLHVVQLDAHADMRDEYSGTKWSHACVMRRIDEMKIPCTAVGIRALSQEEWGFIQPKRKNYFFAHEIAGDPEWMEKVLRTISGPVYLTVDVDCFDSSIIPATGTPEPGGLNWYQVTGFIRKLMKEKKVVGADVVELSPTSAGHSSDFTVAKLVHKMIAYYLQR